MAPILLTTLNARYSHSALGLRYLRANLGRLRAQSELVEFTIEQRPADIAEQLFARQPRLIGIGVYIWNVTQVTELVGVLKRVAPEIVVVIGGPEVSYEFDDHPLCALADYIIRGQADVAFATLCEQVFRGDPPTEKTIDSIPPLPESLRLPYAEYTNEDIAHRVIYVEASRGCPFRCEFCLSARDKTARPFPLEPLLASLDDLYRRGARGFKFVDRTFNLKVDQCRAILEFFLQRLGDNLFLHFELIPDRLPEELKTVIRQFPPDTLQFEVGVQSFNPAVQTTIQRKQDDGRTEANLFWLRQESHAHLHTDLIAGLPGEDLESFATGFDRLVGLHPHEIQVGILKRLRGAPIGRHDDIMRYSPVPPYTVLSTDKLDFITLQRLGRFARYWDLIANSGRFPTTLPLLLGAAPFNRFMAFSDRLFATTGQTHRIQLKRLFALIYHGLTETLSVDHEEAMETLTIDWAQNGLGGAPDLTLRNSNVGQPTRVRERQSRHRPAANAGDDGQA